MKPCERCGAALDADAILERTHAVSFAYANAAMDCPGVTRDMVDAITPYHCTPCRTSARARS